ncbi:T9SS type B sorting domain-containing protein [Rudanella paleaurantiibacter]|uniref:T9SS type B sorting domain-containing protein n=1 Tax=Rudanella paleaurantiibacter TaxID=2614655 RepID=A0A7J5TYR4_9BACT|nr:gliding motility-associated C-terminal domain-containing protein [Rudanella paleaurantiibacter]KAB7730263.1 T9SS type B sorting domain-containing protein [Rudanella paleaurantiibacter]
MHARYTYWLGLVLLLGLLAPTFTYATHVRAGEITTRRVDPNRLEYEITLTTYFDELNGRIASDQTNSVDFCLGDGSIVNVPRSVRRNINSNTSINIYRFRYTYQGPGVYQISVAIEKRNDRTINLRQPSQDITFWIRTTIQVNAGLGLNSTPVLLNPPLDSARTGQRFCHNPAAFDSDGDSLAYRMAIPQESTTGAPCRGFAVNGYRDPARGIDPNAQNEARNGQATLGINPTTGDLCWDSPAVAGQYNIAFIIEEWRDGVLIGEITRDMQIIVTDSRNNRPLLDPIPDLCREAGSLIEVPIRATDPDGQRLELTAFGGIFNRNPDGTQYNPPIVPLPFATLISQPQSGTVTGLIRWQTACAHIRQEEYDVLARVVDVPGRTATQLAALQSFRIRIIAPRPQGLRATPQATATGRAIRLSWNPYTCIPPSTTTTGTSEMLVYRREGCAPLQSGTCTTGLSTSTGYALIGTVPIGTNTFTDTTGLRRGIQYSYRIVARFPPVPLGGESVVSDGVCVDLPLLAPLITQVTVDSTDNQRGQITVRWTRPIGLNPADGGAPFQYRVFRATGLTGTDFTQITAITSSLQPGVADTVFVDRGLNTQANAYRYRIDFFQTSPQGALTRVDATEPAASPRLTLNPALRQIELTWATNTPWSNDNQTHVVFRSRRGTAGPLVEVARVPVQGQPYRYTDTGNSTLAGVQSLSLSVDSNYCYRVLTVGRYTSTTAVRGLLLNYSQIACASPLDTTRPCAPRLSLDSLACDPATQQALCNQTSFSNNLRWQYPPAGQSCEPADRYNLYYSRFSGPAQSFSLVTTTPTTSFRHQSLTTVAGCYYVTAVSRRGIEGPASNTVCQDVCPQFVLPNVFTPNNDGRNDLWQPGSCSVFVVSVETVIYNRWGGRVFSTSDPQIRWDGRNSAGQEQPSGLYYYEVVVRFGGLDPSAPPVVLKGWVQLFRENGASGG